MVRDSFNRWLMLGGLVFGIGLLVIAVTTWPPTRPTPRSVSPAVRITQRDGYPSLRFIIRADSFGDEWPYNTDRVLIEGTLIGVCLVEIDGTAHALNGLAGIGGYPRVEPPIRRRIPWDSELYDEDPGYLMDETPIRNRALQLVEQLQIEWKKGSPAVTNYEGR